MAAVTGVCLNTPSCPYSKQAKDLLDMRMDPGEPWPLLLGWMDLERTAQCRWVQSMA